MRVGSQEVQVEATDVQVRQLEVQSAPEHIAAPTSIVPTSQGQEFAAKTRVVMQEVQFVLVPKQVRQVYEQALQTPTTASKSPLLQMHDPVWRVRDGSHEVQFVAVPEQLRHA